MDSMFMLNLLEVCMFFFDEWLFVMVNVFFDKWKNDGKCNKILFWEVFGKELLLEIFCCLKQGFEVLLFDWFRLFGFVNCYFLFFDCDFVEEQGVFQVGMVEKFIYDFNYGDKLCVQLLWVYFCFQKWY